MTGRVGKTLESAPAATCMKILLMGFNVLFWLSGLIMLAVGIAMKVKLHVYADLSTMYRSEATLVVIALGVIIVVVGTLGCCCTAKGQSGALYTYSAFLMMVFIVELSAAIALFVYRGKVKQGFREGIGKAMKGYATDDDMNAAIDEVQMKLDCCGLDNYTDWFNIKWYGSDTEPNSVPVSCCSRTECVNTHLLKNTTVMSIYTRGCFEKVTSFTEKNFKVLGGVAFGFCFQQLVGSLLACCLARVINKAKYEHVA